MRHSTTPGCRKTRPGVSPRAPGVSLVRSKRGAVWTEDGSLPNVSIPGLKYSFPGSVSRAANPPDLPHISLISSRSPNPTLNFSREALPTDWLCQAADLCLFSFPRPVWSRQRPLTSISYPKPARPSRALFRAHEIWRRSRFRLRPAVHKNLLFHELSHILGFEAQADQATFGSPSAMHPATIRSRSTCRSGSGAIA